MGTTESIVMQSVRDVNSKKIFQDPLLCSQFLRDNLDIPILKNVQPEDIEDVSTNYKSFLGTEFEADTVKKVKLKTELVNDADLSGCDSLYVISLIEHKSDVDYNVIVQLLKYMVCIWTAYAKEMEMRQKGITMTKRFRYPPILPIVYYEGSSRWTAEQHLKDRIMMNDLFADYIPDFTYRLIRIHDYSNEELLSREDEMSLLMMLNKVQTEDDFREFWNAQEEKGNLILQKASDSVLQIIADTIFALCRKMNVPEQEIEQCVEQVRRRRMGVLFENMQKMDIQAERRKTEDAQRQAEDAQRKLEETVVTLCQEYGGTKQKAQALVMEKCELSEQEAMEVVKRYWKE